MNFFESIKGKLGQGIKNHFDKKKEQQEFMERLNFEAEVQRKQIFEEEFKKNALEVAKAKAKKDAASLSGLQKLRAENRYRNLNKQQDTGTFFEKMRDYTQKNLARREDNLKRTEMMREKAEQIKQERTGKIPQVQQRKPFGSTSTWKQ